MPDAIGNQIATIRRALCEVAERLGGSDDVLTHALIALDRIHLDHTMPRTAVVAGDPIAAGLAYWQRYDECIARSGTIDDDAQSDTVDATAIDRGALVAFLQRHFPEERALEIAQVGLASMGFSKKTLILTLDNAKTLPAHVVIRADQPVNLFNSRSVIDEYPLVKLLAEHSCTVPRPFVLEPTGTVLGTPFFLSEQAMGAPEGWSYYSPSSQTAVEGQLAGALAAIHAIPLTALQAGLVSIEPHNLVQALNQMEADWRASGTEEPLMDAACAGLKANLADAQGPLALVHNDFSYQNLLLRDGQLTAVLDWEFAHIGNPAADLGWHIATAYPDTSPDGFLAAYRSAGGRLPSVSEMRFYQLWAYVRMAIFCAQSDASYLDGSANHIKFALSYPLFLPKSLIGIGRILSGTAVNGARARAG